MSLFLIPRPEHKRCLRADISAAARIDLNDLWRGSWAFPGTIPEAQPIARAL
jgi:hypothetical protein